MYYFFLLLQYSLANPELTELNPVRLSESSYRTEKPKKFMKYMFLVWENVFKLFLFTPKIAKHKRTL